MTPTSKWPERIDLVVFDFDGVMTDNRVLVTELGEEAVFCHRGDGWGIACMRSAGVEMFVLSTERNPVVEVRCAKLGVTCHQDVGDKAMFLRNYLGDHDVDPGHVAFVGNDTNDLECLELVGLPVVVADAEPVAAEAAAVVLSRKGGDGAVREFSQLLLQHIGAETARPR